MSYDVEILNWRAYQSNTLQGFLNIRIVELDLEINELTVHSSNGKRWIGLPGKPQIDKERKVIVGTNGKPAYTPILKFSAKEAGDQFSAIVLAAFDQRH